MDEEKQFDESILFKSSISRFKTAHQSFVKRQPEGEMKTRRGKPADPRASSWTKDLKPGTYKAIKDGKAHVLKVRKFQSRLHAFVDFEPGEPLDSFNTGYYERITPLRSRAFKNLKVRFTFQDKDDLFEINFQNPMLLRRLFSFIRAVYKRRI